MNTTRLSQLPIRRVLQPRVGCCARSRPCRKEVCGLKGMQFAAVAGVKYQTFASWVQKRRKVTGMYCQATECSNQDKSTKQAATTMPALSWVEAVVEDAMHEASADVPGMLRLELPCGASL